LLEHELAHEHAIGRRVRPPGKGATARLVPAQQSCPASLHSTSQSIVKP
jgi:hypothetical protein